MSTTSLDPQAVRDGDPTGFPTMLAVMCLATFAATALICLFVEMGGWWLMTVTLVAVIAGAAVVLLAIRHALDGSDG